VWSEGGGGRLGYGIKPLPIGSHSARQSAVFRVRDFLWLRRERLAAGMRRLTDPDKRPNWFCALERHAHKRRGRRGSKAQGKKEGEEFSVVKEKIEKE